MTAVTGTLAAETSARVAELIVKALKGELPRDREPLGAEPQVLSELHINMILDRVAGMTAVEIGEKWDYHPGRVLCVLGHPDAQTIMSTMLAMQAGHLVSLEERFKTLAPLALNTKVALMQNPETPAGVRDRAASDILDRAGFAPRKVEEHKHEHKILMPAQAATGLSEALAAASRIATVDYSRFLQKAGTEVAASDLQAEVGQPSPVGDGPSPVPVPSLPGEVEEVEAA